MWSMCTSATCGASSQALGSRPRSSPCGPSGTASAARADRMRAGLRRLVPGGLRWRLAGWVTLVPLLCTAIGFIAVYGGTGTQLRGQIDSEIAGDAAELAHN